MEHANASEWDLHRQRQQPALVGDDSQWQIVTKPDKGKRRQEVANTRHDQRRWQDLKGQQPQQPLQHTRAPKLIDDEEGDDAQALWRALEPAKLFVRVPAEVVIAEGVDALQQLAKQFGTYVALERRQHTGPDSQVFGIWGSGKDAEATRKAIVGWIEGMMGPKKASSASKFAKLASMTPTLRVRAENRWKREVQRQRFRQHPPLDVAFGAIGTFHWPVKEYAPHEILGANYEPLDPIRIDCSCYVVWKKNAFQVMGRNMDKVKAALLRLRQTVFRQPRSSCPRYALHWPNGVRSDEIQLLPYEQLRQLSGPPTSEPKQHPVVQGEGVRSETNERASSQSLSSQRQIYTSILRTLGKLPHYHGSIKMRVHLGRFLATQYMVSENGRYDLEDYENMIKESQFQGLVTNELGDLEMEQSALKSLQGTKDFLIPLSHTSKNLSDTKSICTAIFTFADRLGDLRLEASWQPTEDSDPEAAPFSDPLCKWTRLDRDTASTSSLIDISLTDLTTSYGWAFTIQAAQSVDEDRIEPALVNFAHGLAIDSAAALRQANDKPFVKFNAYIPNTALKSYEQRFTYSYAMHGIDYNVEITRFQKFVYPEKNKGSVIPSAPTQIRTFEPRWGVSVHRGEWDSLFAENERPSVGEKASWDADSERWFPNVLKDPEDADKGRYFSRLVAKLDELGDVLRSGAQVENVLGGMSIG